MNLTDIFKRAETEKGIFVNVELNMVHKTYYGDMKVYKYFLVDKHGNDIYRDGSAFHYDLEECYEHLKNMLDDPANANWRGWLDVDEHGYNIIKHKEMENEL